MPSGSLYSVLLNSEVNGKKMTKEEAVKMIEAKTPKKKAAKRKTATKKKPAAKKTTKKK